MTNTIDSDDATIERLRALPDDDKRVALVDVVLDTATWQPAVGEAVANVEARSR
jgi:hypothetical protein